jgi:adenosylhomocysteine nucleosidase
MKAGPLNRFRGFSALVAVVSTVVALNTAEAGGIVEATPRTAVISAYAPEWTELRAALHVPRRYVINGTAFLTGTIENKPVLLFLSGISMVNAAMTSQLALERFNVSRIVFSGIAGGVDPGLSIGDVAVPEQWSEYLEAAFSRQTERGYKLPSFESNRLKNFGMIFPQPVEIVTADGPPERREWFPIDAHLMAVAKSVSRAVNLRHHVATATTVDRLCDVDHVPVMFYKSTRP